MSNPTEWPQGAERRHGDRRQAERRSRDRGGPDRRKGDRRAAAGGALLTLAMMAGVPAKSEADIFTRRNARGVVEATNFPDREGFKLAYRSKGVVTHSPGFQLRPSNNRQYDAHIEAAAALHGVSSQLVRAVIQVESQFDPRAVSSAGARGLMQLMPDTARRLGVADSFDPRQNILGGVKYLRMLLDMFRGDVSLAVAGYNAGENAVVRHGGVPPYRETQGYVRKIQALLTGGSSTPLAPAPVLAAAAEPALFITPGSSAAPSATQRTAAAARPPAAAPRAIYKWTDDQGRLRISDTAPTGNVKFVLVRTTD
jgi:hypothetical protein